MDNVVIIGANRGIGLALAQAHATRGDRVTAVCRHGAEALDALPVRIIDGIDVCNDAAVAGLAADLADTRIDRLIVNAGILAEERFDQLDEAAFAAIERQFEVNALAPLRVVHALVERLARPARIGLLTSRMGSMADNGSGGYYGYRASKAALNAIGRSLAVDLLAREVAVVLLHPGFVRTDMTDGHGDVSPAQSAAGLIARMDALDLATSGQFVHANGAVLPW